MSSYASGFVQENLDSEDIQYCTIEEDEGDEFENENVDLSKQTLRDISVLLKTLKRDEHNNSEEKQQDASRRTTPILPVVQRTNSRGDRLLSHDELIKDNNDLRDKIEFLTKECEASHSRLQNSQALFASLQNQRDFHRLQHRRLTNEKKELYKELKQLQSHSESFPPTIAMLKAKCEKNDREKAMLKIERDRYKQKTEKLEAEVAKLKAELNPPSLKKKLETTAPQQAVEPAESIWPPLEMSNLNTRAKASPPSLDISKYKLRNTVKAHNEAVSSSSFHPKKNIFATASDERRWKLWSGTTGEVILSADGHLDYISAIEFLPDGSSLCTSSGDGTLKLWNLKELIHASRRQNNPSTSPKNSFQPRTLALSQSSQCPLLDVSIHSSGLYAASGGIDGVARIWDLQSEKVRLALRGHRNSINAIKWQPFGNVILTGSADKTINLWDVRNGQCIHTYVADSSNASILSLSFHESGEIFASGDTAGTMRIWETRKGDYVYEHSSSNNYPTPSPIHSVELDLAGTQLLAGSEDGIVRSWKLNPSSSDSDSTPAWELTNEWTGHQGSVQDVRWNYSDSSVISVGFDGTWRKWAET